MEISTTNIPAEYNQKLFFQFYAVAILAMNKVVSTSTRAYEKLQYGRKIHCGWKYFQFK